VIVATAPPTQRAGHVIVPMRPGDLDAVYRIAEGAFPIPWPRHELERELERPWASIRVLRPASGQPIAAFANYWHLGSELQIMNLATAPRVRRRGYARALLNDVLQAARRVGARTVSLEVRPSNEPAIALYRAAGFQAVGRRPGYYSDNGEDALILRFEL
jgi:ribosomal-protein-alanine N-acetyltransferase